MKTFSQFRFWALPVFLCLLFLAGCGGPSYYADVTLLRAPSAPKAHTAAIGTRRRHGWKRSRLQPGG